MKNLPSSDILERFRKEGVAFKANDNIHEHLLPGEFDALSRELEGAMESVLDALLIDQENDHNTKDTAKRVAKMYLNEVFKGRYSARPDITEFPNARQLDEIYVVGPISIRSTCSHHMVPIVGQAWCGILPSNKVIGLSKFNRLVDWMMSRPHIQEEASVMLADTLEDLLEPKGLGLIIKATHMCMTHRGVKEHDAFMTNSIMRGEFRKNSSVRHEFFEIIKAHGFL